MSAMPARWATFALDGGRPTRRSAMLDTIALSKGKKWQVPCLCNADLDITVQRGLQRKWSVQVAPTRRLPGKPLALPVQKDTTATTKVVALQQSPLPTFLAQLDTIVKKALKKLNSILAQWDRLVTAPTCTPKVNACRAPLATTVPPVASLSQLTSVPWDRTAPAVQPPQNQETVRLATRAALTLTARQEVQHRRSAQLVRTTPSRVRPAVRTALRAHLASTARPPERRTTATPVTCASSDPKKLRLTGPGLILCLTKPLVVTSALKASTARAVRSSQRCANQVRTIPTRRKESAWCAQLGSRALIQAWTLLWNVPRITTVQKAQSLQLPAQAARTAGPLTVPRQQGWKKRLNASSAQQVDSARVG